MSNRHRHIVSLAALALAVAAGRTSHADCTAQLAPLFQAGGAHIQMTIGTNDLKWVAYSNDTIPLYNGTLNAPIKLLFSDRTFSRATAPNSFGDAQPFDVEKGDTVTPFIDPHGHVYFYDNTWNVWFGDFMATCTNGYLYGFYGNNMVTMALSPWTPAPPPR